MARTDRPTSPLTSAAGTAFTARVPARFRTATEPVRARLQRFAIGFVAGFPGLVGLAGIVAAFTRAGVDDLAFRFGAVCVVAAATLLILGSRSFIAVDEEGLAVRFYGIRTTRIRWEEMASATFGLLPPPSISFAITIRPRRGRKVIFHANWWRRESEILARVARQIVDRGVAVDHGTARIVGHALDVPPPGTRIIHRALFRRDRTW